MERQLIHTAPAPLIGRKAASQEEAATESQSTDLDSCFFTLLLERVLMAHHPVEVVVPRNKLVSNPRSSHRTSASNLVKRMKHRYQARSRLEWTKRSQSCTWRPRTSNSQTALLQQPAPAKGELKKDQRSRRSFDELSKLSTGGTSHRVIHTTTRSRLHQYPGHQDSRLKGGNQLVALTHSWKIHRDQVTLMPSQTKAEA